MKMLSVVNTDANSLAFGNGNAFFLLFTNCSASPSYHLMGLPELTLHDAVLGVSIVQVNSAVSKGVV